MPAVIPGPTGLSSLATITPGCLWPQIFLYLPDSYPCPSGQDQMVDTVVAIWNQHQTKKGSIVSVLQTTLHSDFEGVQL